MVTRFHLTTAVSAALLLALTITAFAQQNSTAQQALDKQQPVYIENRGQWDRQAKFLIRSNGLDLWITDHGVVYDINRVEQTDAKGSTATTMSADDKPVVHRTPVFMTFLGASDHAAARGSERAAGYHNYFIGNDPTKWATNVPLYNGARIEKLYSGIDAVFYLDQGR